jgi:hypothetical protein
MNSTPTCDLSEAARGWYSTPGTDEASGTKVV